jgi:hypothetical protein
MAQIAGLQDFRQEGPPGDIGTYQMPCSVLVFQFTFSGTTYIVAMRSGVSGWSLISQGTDAATVINAAIADGGFALMKAGFYTIQSVIAIKKPTVLRGSGATLDSDPTGTVLLAGAGLNGQNGVISIDEAAVINFVSLSDFTIRNDQANNSIYIRSLADAWIERLFLNHAPQNGIYIEGKLDMWNIWIKDCLIENITLTGINFDPQSHNIVKVHILDNYLFYCDLGIKLQRTVGTGTVKQANIHGNQLFDIGKVSIHLWKACSQIEVSENIVWRSGVDAANTYNGIRVGDAGVSGDKCTHIGIHDNHVDGQATTKYGISVEGFTNFITICGNDVFGCVSGSYNQDAGVTNVIKRHNQGITGGDDFQNWGVATILNLGTSVVVTHGLSTTPTNIKCTGTQVEVSAPFVTAVGAVNFTINVAVAVTANRDVYWYAEV